MTIINTAIKAAIRAGEEILKIYKDPTSDFSIEKKADNSPLTIADKASHQVIEAALAETGIPILSEEGKTIEYEERRHWNTFWLIDPLDGTKEFIKKNGEFTVNIALVKNNQPVMGVIYVPVSETLYFGSPEDGAWKLEDANENCDLEQLKAKGQELPAPLSSEVFKVVGSRSHMSQETEDYINELKKEHPQIEIVSKGSSLKICMVAEGSAHQYPRFGPTMEWDTAAGHAIANAAGKHLMLTDLSEELKYNKENLLNPYFIVK
ncbi:3'(2'),5'-bisphosphate nucleotidase CysQ [Draconibacterium sp. IB214405]|uniref:3'(2'),5'-bisphosphate nucleotidase CysQ n=1 Tax=Draconibacterium sp. IB214405 TaxID=3097352 RepID=UPI002A157612|nr:3'(2'),5'-bisphosphate nucleotidase CysQ [Draconibacterium sp. IB214405]MDX8339308.1 3'(2'),5'-bisphosphate nucleotidase CysQ [Draconibacterium sp. IB214405]